MKKILLFCLFAITAQVGYSQTDEYKAGNEGWLVKIDDAYEQSNKTGKPILANFTGSDWCGWCIKLTGSVFSKKEFQEWAEKNVILLELDYPKRKQIPDEIRAQNAELQKAFQIRGFPTVWVFNLKKDDKGHFSIEPLGKTQYTPTATKFISDVEKMIAQGK